MVTQWLFVVTAQELSDELDPLGGLLGGRQLVLPVLRDEAGDLCRKKCSVEA